MNWTVWCSELCNALLALPWWYTCITSQSTSQHDLNHSCFGDVSLTPLWSLHSREWTLIKVNKHSSTGIRTGSNVQHATNQHLTPSFLVETGWNFDFHPILPGWGEKRGELNKQLWGVSSPAGQKTTPRFLLWYFKQKIATFQKCVKGQE